MTSAGPTPKHTFVVPRYGLEVVGGAELGARMIAERLVSQLGWSVEIFTTCAKDHMTWVDEYEPGEEVINGVVVRRFHCSGGRPPEFFPYSEKILNAPSAATLGEAERFIDLQGPGCPDLIDALSASDRDTFDFYPYLYATAVRGVPAVADRAIMHPAAHDEPALHLPIFQKTMRLAKGFIYHTRGEQELVERLFPVAQLPSTVIGLGYEPAPEDLNSTTSGGESPSGADAVTGLGDRPYLLSLGRVDGFKGTTLLAGFFAAYKQRNPGPLALVIAGPVTAQPPAHPDVIVTGPVDESVKWQLIRGSTAFVHPSPHESFSIVLMEAFSESKPVVVNGQCAATVEHCERSGGGVWFDSYADFEVIVDLLVGDEAMRSEMGRRAKQYVESNYRWPVLIERYANFVEEIASTT